MNKGIVFLFFSLFFIQNSFGQRNILKYSGTLIDASENPQRQLFQDSCKSWATNFPLFFPAFNFIDFQVKGDANKPIVGFIFSRDLDPYLQELQNGTGKTNRLNIDSRVTPFMLRFRTSKKKQSEFSIFIQNRISGQATLQNEFFNYYFRGNAPFKGEVLNGVFDTKFYAQIYTSLNLGYRTNVNDKISFGSTLSIINGFANASIEIQNSSLFTEKNLEYVELKARGTARTSFNIDSIDLQEMYSEYSNFANLGLGISGGIQYKVNPKFAIDFSAKDIGFIRWTGKEASTYSLDKNSRYEGENVLGEPRNLDSVLNLLFKYDTQKSKGSFTTYLPTIFDLGFNFKPNKFFRTSLIVSNTLGFSDIDFSFIADLKILGGLHLVGLSTVSTNSFTNFGAEFLIRSKGLDFYFGSEKLLNTYNFFNAIQPEDIKYSLGADLHMGIAFRFGSCPKEKITTIVQKDSDGDGVLDFLDNCPFVFGLPSNKGCPILDTDGDGVLDSSDKCPTIKGSIQNFGCPFEDQDKDGVLDKEDQCPTLAGPISNKGCPFQDSDGDGVLDSADKCPNVPGLIELNGCPPIKKTILEPEEEKIVSAVFKNLQFQSGNSILLPSSFPSLNSLANLLISKPNVKLIVEGHTDFSGDATKNILLSLKRAEVVKTYLIERGIPSERIVTLGYGSERPIDTNDTPQGRAKNRRVEFIIID